jgi:hypothetical protein
MWIVHAVTLRKRLYLTIIGQIKAQPRSSTITSLAAHPSTNGQTTSHEAAVERAASTAS